MAPIDWPLPRSTGRTLAALLVVTFLIAGCADATLPSGSAAPTASAPTSTGDPSASAATPVATPAAEPSPTAAPTSAGDQPVDGRYREADPGCARHHGHGRPARPLAAARRRGVAEVRPAAPEGHAAVVIGGPVEASGYYVVRGCPGRVRRSAGASTPAGWRSPTTTGPRGSRRGGRHAGLELAIGAGGPPRGEARRREGGGGRPECLRHRPVQANTKDPALRPGRQGHRDVALQHRHRAGHGPRRREGRHRSRDGQGAARRRLGYAWAPGSTPWTRS